MILVYFKKIGQRERERKRTEQGTIVFGFCIGMVGVKMLHVFQEIRIVLLQCMSHDLVTKKIKCYC